MRPLKHGDFAFFKVDGKRILVTVHDASHRGYRVSAPGYGGYSLIQRDQLDAVSNWRALLFILFGR
jgi:hypothetical protein